MYPILKPYRVTSGYGYRVSPITKKKEFHPGIDLVSDSGDKSLIACTDGEVIDSKHDYNDANRWNLGGKDTVGNRMVVKSVIDGKNYYWSYYHTEINKTQVGDKVKKGDVLGTYGDVGYSAGAHVHLQCWDEKGFNKTGIAIDPSFLLEIE